MTIFAGAKCPVQSCPCNLQERGVTCAWLIGRSRHCHHPQWRELWSQLTEAQEAKEAPAPRSLTGRVTAASKPMAPERARQLALSLE